MNTTRQVEILALGGVRAAIWHVQSGVRLRLFPTLDGADVDMSLEKEIDYYKVLKGAGLDIVGFDEWVTGEEAEFSLWHLFFPRKRTLETDDFWRGIAFTATTAGDEPTASLAKKIAFSLLTSSLRLRDCAREYAWQNAHAAQTKVAINRRFSNMKMFDLYMALHSVLVEMCSARDYLAQFVSTNILRQTDPVDSMSLLVRRLKKEPTKSPLVKTILDICDRNSSSGWMARLSEFRNIIAHRAPIISLVKEDYLVTQSFEIGENTMRKIYLAIPRDPISSLDTEFVDALEHFRLLLLLLRDFAHTVAEQSEIKPTMQHIGPGDILGDVRRVEVRNAT